MNARYILSERLSLVEIKRQKAANIGKGKRKKEKEGKKEKEEKKEKKEKKKNNCQSNK